MVKGRRSAERRPLAFKRIKSEKTVHSVKKDFLSLKDGKESAIL